MNMRYIYKDTCRKSSIIIIFVFLLLFSACVSQPTEITETTEAAPEVPLPAPKPEEVKVPVPEVRPPAGTGLNAPQFRGLPREVNEYLTVLAEAFRKKDREFLVSQGEIQYEKEFRFRYDDESYLALLYRIGPYSDESGWKSPVLPKIDAATIRAIEYTGWEEKGPMLSIKGRLHLEKGTPLPCEIILVWRLPEPKILGAHP